MQKSSQEARIHSLLKSRGQEWTPAPELAAISLQYAARLYSLRHDQGVAIENRVEIKGGVKHGFYRLAQTKAPTAAAAISADTALLFGPVAPERYSYPD